MRFSLVEDECGPVDVDLDKVAVNQLWDEFKGVTEVENCCMRLILKVFKAAEGNGLSPFAISINTPGDLSKLVN